MGWLSNFFSDPWKAMLDVPGSPEAVIQSVVDGSGSDGLSWNPFYQEGPSVWDRGALGYKLSDQDQERAHGRMFGRAVAAYGTGGYSEMALSPAEVKAKGGTDKDALRAGAKAYALAGANNYLGSYDAAGGMGVDHPVYKGAINGALSSGATTAIGGGNSTQIGQSMVKGGIGGGLDGYRGGNMDYEENGYRNDSAQENPFSPYIDKLLGNFKTNNQWDGKKIGNFGEGLMGLYGGYKQRQMANQLMRGMNHRRNDYEVNLRNELLRKDAQAGRRSNYAGRAVQLQSGLAQLDAQQMPMMAQLSNSSLGGLFNMLKSGYSTANSMGAFSPAQQQPVASNGVPFLPSLYQQPMQPQAYSLGTDASLGDSSGGNPFTVRPRNKLFGGS